MTTLSSGTLSVDSPSDVDPGTLTISGGELLGTASVTLTNPLAMSGSFTIAAVHGTTLWLAGSAPYDLAPNTEVTFGSVGNDGTVLWSTRLDRTSPHQT